MRSIAKTFLFYNYTDWKYTIARFSLRSVGCAELSSFGCARYIYPSIPKNRDFVNSTLTKLEIAEAWTICNFNLV